MRRSMLVALVALAVLSLGALGAMAKTDFSGTWVLDIKQSEGIWQGTEQTLTVKQEGERIDVELKAKSPQGERTIKESYVPDGREVEFAPPGSLGKGKRTAKWTADGTGIEISDLYDVQTPEGADTMKAWRKWTLSGEGKTLTIEQTLDTPQGTQQSKRIFNKQ